MTILKNFSITKTFSNIMYYYNTTNFYVSELKMANQYRNLKLQLLYDRLN